MWNQINIMSTGALALCILFAGVTVLLVAYLTSGNIIKVQRNENLKSAITNVDLNENPNGGFDLVLTDANNAEIVLGQVGRTLGAVVLDKYQFDDETIVSFSSNFNLSMDFTADDDILKIRMSWKGNKNLRFEDCFDFGAKQWFGGPQLKDQYWPIQHSAMDEYSYVSKEDDNAAVIERYWLNSDGEYYYVEPQVPLFVDHNNIVDNHICFVAEVKAPYSQQRQLNELTYDIWILDNAKVAHQHAVDNYLGKPTGIPDYRMIQHPVWSTWAKYSREIDENTLREFANDIVDNGFNNAQFEIDDLWEVCYGSLTVDENKFSDFGALVQEIKSMGFRVTIWVHPFINQGCEPWYSNALENGYLVLNEEGSPDTSWWNDNGTIAAYIDFTNPEARDWYSSRLTDLMETYDIDSLKFDAGEMSWSPQIAVQTGDIENHPSNIVQDYVRLCAEFGPIVEVRSGARTQDLPIFIRIVDKDTLWDHNNGLATLLTTLLVMNLSGYTLVLPDMIGGNGYNEKPSKELFIRWLQANVFMPSLQYSFVPWDFDNEAIEISHKYTNLHADYADAIVDAMQASVSDGTPVNGPIWWIDPTDATALAIWDEYLLGENILVAPVIEENSVTRDIYLPVGTWLEEGDPERVYVGPQWLYNHPAALDYLPYFVKQA